MGGRDVESWCYRPDYTFYTSIPDLRWRGDRLRGPTGRAQARVRRMYNRIIHGKEKGYRKLFHLVNSNCFISCELLMKYVFTPSPKFAVTSATARFLKL